MAFRKAARFCFGVLSLVVVSTALLSTQVRGDKVDDVLQALLNDVRSKHQDDHSYSASQGIGNLDEIAGLGGAIMKAFAPILLDEDRDESDTNVTIPNIRFLAYITGEEEEAKEDRNNRHLIEEDASAEEKEDGDVAAAGAHAWTTDDQAVHTWTSMMQKLLQRWPIWVDGIWMVRGSSLGGGTCTFDFESHKNFRYLPLQWKMTDATCSEFPKTDLRNAGNIYCVRFKLFQYVSFTHCAPHAYWRDLVQGNIISINPTNGATVIDGLNLLQSGGLDQFLPLRSALGQGGILDILNYL